MSEGPGGGEESTVVRESERIVAACVSVFVTLVLCA